MFFLPWRYTLGTKLKSVFLVLLILSLILVESVLCTALSRIRAWKMCLVRERRQKSNISDLTTEPDVFSNSFPVSLHTPQRRHSRNQGRGSDSTRREMWSVICAPCINSERPGSFVLFLIKYRHIFHCSGMCIFSDKIFRRFVITHVID